MSRVTKTTEKTYDNSSSTKKESTSLMAKSRRARVIKRLEIQLSAGTKTDKSGASVSLVESDIKRINLELETLKKRI